MRGGEHAPADALLLDLGGAHTQSIFSATDHCLRAQRETEVVDLFLSAQPHPLSSHDGSPER